MKRERTAPWDRRRDKNGGYARTRRYEKALDRKGLEEREVLVGAFRAPERMSDGKFQINIYRDVICRKRRVRHPKHSAAPDFSELSKDGES